MTSIAEKNKHNKDKVFSTETADVTKNIKLEKKNRNPNRQRYTKFKSFEFGCPN